MKSKESMAINNPIKGPPATIKRGRLQPAIRSLNVREKPDINSRVKFILRDNVPFSFTISPENPDWCIIEDTHEIGVAVGYAMSKYIIEASGDSS